MKANAEESVFRVFVSSTHDDLRGYRAAARDAALRSGFMPIMSEHWSAAGDRPPLKRCLEEVSRCDLLIVIVAHRYGWVPEGQQPDVDKSMTWLECEQAVQEGKEVICFVLDEPAQWPVEHREEYRLAAAVRKDEASQELMQEVVRNVRRLKDFKRWLSSSGIRATFSSEGELLGEVSAALNDWRIRHNVLLATHRALDDDRVDPSRALKYLYEQSRFIDIRGLQVGSGKAYQFPIEDLFIPLHAKAPSGQSAHAERYVELNYALRYRKVVIIGDPGSGKTTFLRRICHFMTGARLKITPSAPDDSLGLPREAPFPLLVRMSELGSFMMRERDDELPVTADSPEWLVGFLARVSIEHGWGLDKKFFRGILKSGEAMLLLDGFDEAATEAVRKRISRLLENTSSTYADCRFVVTSRPTAYQGEAILAGFEEIYVAPLKDTAIDTFLNHWCSALFPDAPELASEHRCELVRALDLRPDIRRMATNPVMLTALAVVHWNEKRIPEQRAELYESIICWLSRAREARPGRPRPEQTVVLLQAIALAMQDAPDGRQTQWSRGKAAEHIAPLMNGKSTPDVEVAESYLREEELDSGIIVARGNEVRFWHLSFQEFLAARAIASMAESEQRRILLNNRGKLFSSEWRETVLLLAGILYRQGSQKAEAMIDAILNDPETSRSIAAEAQTVGLVGAIQRDLSPSGHKVTSRQFQSMIEKVMQIFDPAASEAIKIEIRLEAAEALGQVGDPRLTVDPWITIDADSFFIGLQGDDPHAPGFDAGALAHESPVRLIELDGFSIARFPVTVIDFQKFIADNGYLEPDYWSLGAFGRWKNPEQWENQLRFPTSPVVGISWYEATAYCAWKGFGTHLPTEAQWERAARGKEGRRYPWGNERPTPDRLNYHYSPLDRLHNPELSPLGKVTPVGFYPKGATPEGVLDLAGNIFEWCLDAVTEHVDFKGNIGIAEDITFRAVRGGAFNSVSHFVRSGFRARFPAASRSDTVGFRLCRSTMVGERGFR